MQETYQVEENYDDTNIVDYLSYNLCLNNPVSVMTINMQNSMNNITELFNAWGTTNERNPDTNQGFGIFIDFTFTSIKFDESFNHYHIIRKKDSTDCIIIHDNYLPSSNVMEFTYYIDEMDWEEGTTITELNENIATNIAYCLNHNTIKDVNSNILKQGYYFIANDNMVKIYSCNNDCCTDLTIQYARDIFNNQPVVANESSVTEINNESENSMYANYYSLDTGYQQIPLVIPSECSFITLTVTSGSWPSEITWEILNSSGIVIESGGHGVSITLCLEAGDYTFNGFDSYGDGWNGATFTIIDDNTGDILESGQVVGSSGSWPFTIPSTAASAYTLEEYQYILNILIDAITEELKLLYPEEFKDMVTVAYTIIKDNKLYLTHDENVVYFPIWLSGTGVTVKPVYTNAYIQNLSPGEVIENWGYYATNVLQITNY